MQSFGRAGYKNKISQFVVGCLGEEKEEKVDLDVVGSLEKKYAIALQSAWRSRAAREYVSALKQEKNCIDDRNSHPEVREDGTHVVPNCVTCRRGDRDAELKQKLDRMKFKEVEKLLFQGHQKVTISDSGDNWNQRYQRIMSLPENTAIDRAQKYSQLSMLNNDFVITAKTYAQTIISEYYLHTKDKSIRAKNLGGIAGGQKYLWRGILFKMSDGSFGPYNGSDEAAAKAAGHDLKGAIHYRTSGVDELFLPLMALIDYKGFRMSAQAFLPLGSNSLVYGSADGGKTVLKSNEEFNKAMEKAAGELNLCGHIVGRVGGLQLLHSAVDIEGHVGMDNRFYLLDMSRSFPPESPAVTTHLDDIHGDGTIVLIKLQDPQTLSFTYTKGTVHRAYPHGKCYDILFDDGSIARRFPASLIQKKNLSIFWRLLRPEYVKERGRRLVPLTVADIARPCSECAEPASVQIESDSSRYMDYMQNVVNKYHEEGENVDTYATATYDSFDSRKERDGGKENVGCEEDEVRYDSFDDAEGHMSGGEGDDVTYDSFDEKDERHSASVRISSTDEFVEEESPSDYGQFDIPVPSVTENVTLQNVVIAHLSSTHDFVEVDNPVLQSAYGEFNQYDAVVSKYEEESPPHSDNEETEVEKAYSASVNPLSPTRPSQRTIAKADASLPPCPLSPDALSGFSNFDPAAVERNREIMRATERLVQEVIPALAKELESMRPFLICKLNFSVFFHSHGVNIRHMGLVRSHLPVSNATSPVRTALLMQIVARTLKNIARDYQRRWMKSEQSTSEQGMHMLLIEFLNLVVGSNDCSESFWTDKVVVGIIQRFGACALDHDVNHLHRLRKRPQFLKALVANLLDMLGLHMKDKVMRQFLKEANPFQFEFILQDVAYMEPKVKCMHIVDFGTGIMLQELAENKEHQGGDLRTIRRLRNLANEHFLGAEKTLPNYAPTQKLRAAIAETRRHKRNALTS